MPETRTIEIDFEVHKRIELARVSFSEDDNSVLRRLLGIEAREPTLLSKVNGKAWSGKGVDLPHGTELKMDYNGRQYAGVIDNGMWQIDGKRFRSPSAAAGGVALTKKGKQPSLDGWIYWKAKRPGDTRWIPINKLRA